MATTRSLHITIQSILVAGSLGIVALYVILYYGQLLGPGELLGTSPLNIIIAGIHIVYFLLIRMYINQRSLSIATALDLGLFSVNLAILLLVTGGMSSPYFMFWILSVLFSAAVSRYAVVTFTGLTLLYFILMAAVADIPLAYVQNFGAHLAATLIAAGLGMWLWRHHPIEEASTDRVASELSEKLEVEQLKSEILLKSIGDGVLVVDLAGNIQLFNPPAETITAWEENEAVGIHYQQVLPLEDEKGNRLEGENNPFYTAIVGKRSVKRRDVVVFNRNQRKLNLGLTVAPIFASTDTVTGAVAVFSDISQEKQAARQRDEFISTASHEMRTPVAAIEGFLALALNPKVSTIDENAQKYIQKAYDSTQHLGKLFRDLLSITKLEDGRLKNNPEPFELGKVIKGAIDELQFKAEQKNLELKLKSSSGLTSSQKGVMPLFYVNADPERIREVFVNLVDNAIKFTPQGEVTVSIDGDEKEVVIGVHDQGVGIPEDEIKHLFQKFYRVDNSKTREIGGTGLGLYLSRTIIEMYSGRIWVESEENKGSSFYFTLPRLTYSQAQEIRDKLEKQQATTSQAEQTSTNTASTAAGQEVTPSQSG